MDYNNDQRAAIERLVNFALVERAPALTLIGPGGSGKTTCVMDAVSQCKAAGLKVLLAAPTNKAVKQLEKSAREYGLNLDNIAFTTVHRALGLAVLPNEDRKFTVRVGKSLLEIFDLVIIDEASMLSRYALFDYLMPDAVQFHTKLIFMGDDMQLPPPKEPISPVFTEFETIRLEQIMRQAEGSQILSVAGALRVAMKGDKPFRAPALLLGNDDVAEVKAAQFLHHVVDAFTLDTDLDEQRVLAWTNRRVGQINAAIRKKLYGENVEPFEIDERVVTGGPLRDGEGEIRLGTDEECRVHHVNTGASLIDEENGEEYRVIQLVLEPIHADTGQVFANVLHASEQGRFDERLNFLAKRAREDHGNRRQWWAMFWKFKELFNDIRYCYCITVHRSQGSTYDRVFVDVKDILDNRQRRERQRLLYVAYSRPRHHLLINKAKYVA